MDREQISTEMLAAVMFENWLRFRFIEENGEGEIIFQIPEQELVKISDQESSLVWLGVALNGEKVEFTTSRDALLGWLRDHFTTAGIPPLTWQAVLNSSEFKEEVDNFQTWLETHAATLPETDFSEWQRLYEKWKANNSL